MAIRGGFGPVFLNVWLTATRRHSCVPAAGRSSDCSRLDSKFAWIKSVDQRAEVTAYLAKEIGDHAINGVPVSKIVEKIVAATSGDGEVQTNRMRQISGWRF
jgi:hypothetical protein